MRRLISSRCPSIRFAAILAVALIVGSTATVAAKRPPSPSPSPSASVTVASSGTMAPNGESVVVDVTATCAVGWSWVYGRLYILRGDLGGAGTFSVPCTGTAQVTHVTVVNGNRFQLGDWTATAYVGISRNGQQATVTSTRTIRLEPGVTAQVANQGQLTGTSGGGVRIAVAVACPAGTTGLQSSVTVSQDGTALGGAPLTPTCDGQTRSVLLDLGLAGDVPHRQRGRRRLRHCHVERRGVLRGRQPRDHAPRVLDRRHDAPNHAGRIERQCVRGW